MASGLGWRVAPARCLGAPDQRLQARPSSDIAAQLVGRVGLTASLVERRNWVGHHLSYADADSALAAMSEEPEGRAISQLRGPSMLAYQLRAPSHLPASPITMRATIGHHPQVAFCTENNGDGWGAGMAAHCPFWRSKLRHHVTPQIRSCTSGLPPLTVASKLL
ncbi:hypothetical protein CC78DRAFT_580714 [Lojkania enalia]|uniref:Uncharacterized protein n=1 Tax=Lojkania enalia TaxID=147567 RepID=A0A9P4N416_9PLEO|nr:hypothetical protein CC78DRAFT_580714 [Didymosphaeria enalia]